MRCSNISSSGPQQSRPGGFRALARAVDAVEAVGDGRRATRVNVTGSTDQDETMGPGIGSSARFH